MVEWHIMRGTGKHISRGKRVPSQDPCNSVRCQVPKCVFDLDGSLARIWTAIAVSDDFKECLDAFFDQWQLFVQAEV